MSGTRFVTNSHRFQAVFIYQRHEMRAKDLGWPPRLRPLGWLVGWVVRIQQMPMPLKQTTALSPVVGAVAVWHLCILNLQSVSVILLSANNNIRSLQLKLALGYFLEVS